MTQRTSASIAAAAALPSSIPMLNAAHQRASQEGWQADALIERMIDLLTVQLGIEILKLIDGRVSTEVDARLSYDTDATIHKARELIGLYEAAGIDRARVLIKIASTWQGIKAAELLQKENIRCNLTLLFSLVQTLYLWHLDPRVWLTAYLTACAEAGGDRGSPHRRRVGDQAIRSGKDYVKPGTDAWIDALEKTLWPSRKRPAASCGR